MACAVPLAGIRNVMESMKLWRSSEIGWPAKGGYPSLVENLNMENIDGTANGAGGLEPADGGSTTADLGCIRDPLAYADTLIERAQDRLSYGRRQEAEEALKFLSEARFCIKAARAPGEG